MSLLSWLDDPPADRGLHVAGVADPGFQFCSYARLAELARRAAERFRRAGIRPGEAVVLVRPSSVEFLADFFGSLLSGATPAPLPPPGLLRDQATYLDRLSSVLRVGGARAVATTPELAGLLAPLMSAAGRVLVVDASAEQRQLGEALPVPETGLIQFSSGSTRAPHGLRIPMPALQANIDAISAWLGTTAGDNCASWLPLHHDMGLIGCALMPIASTATVTLMPPERFIRSPVDWLRCFDLGGGTITAIPPFGLRHLLRRVRPSDLDGLNLGGWRHLVVGAERIDPALLEQFERMLAPYGLPPRMIRPAYGLAESTCAVTGVPGGTRWSSRLADGGSLMPGVRVRPAGHLAAGRRVVGCGPPLPGMSVRVVDEGGRPVADEVLGEIEVGGASLASGYVAAEGAGGQPFTRPIRTGDAGFLSGGELYVVGRLGDAVKQLGRWFFAEDADQAAMAESPRPHGTVVLLGEWDGRSTAVVLVEGAIDEAAETIGRAVARRADDLRVVVIAVPSRTIRRTTSGKPQRRAMWQRFVAGRLGGTVRWDSADPVAPAVPRSGAVAGLP